MQHCCHNYSNVLVTKIVTCSCIVNGGIHTCHLNLWFEYKGTYAAATVGKVQVYFCTLTYPMGNEVHVICTEHAKIRTLHAYIIHMPINMPKIWFMSNACHMQGIGTYFVCITCVHVCTRTCILLRL